MIFEALQSKLFIFKFHSLGSKILKFPEFNLGMDIKFLRCEILQFLYYENVWSVIFIIPIKLFGWVNVQNCVAPLKILMTRI